MTLLVLILLVGLIFLYASHRQTAERIALLEGEVDALRQALEAPYRAEAERRSAMLRAAAEAEAPSVETEPEETAEIAPPAAFEAGTSRDEAGRDEAWLHDEPSAPDTLAGLFERFVGGRLLIWTGGIALAVAGVFLVRYSIEIGLVTPRVRMIMAAVFGLGLLGAGEWARRDAGFARDPRIAQALVGAGIFVLYATTYGSMALYGLIPVAVASALMAAITAAALALALRHGAPTAVMGLIGGFVTPLLVGDPDAGAVPLLVYLALLDGALFALAWRRGWTWLAAAATGLSFLWTASLLFADPRDAVAGGLFIVALSVAAALFRPGEGRELRLIHPAAVGLLQLAALTARIDIGLAGWALFGALSAACLWLGARGSDYRPLPPLAIGCALLLLALKVRVDPWVEEAAVATTLLFAGGAGWRREPRLLWTAVAVAAFVFPVLILRGGRADLLEPPLWGVFLALLAIGPAALVWRQRDQADVAAIDPPILIAAAGAALLLAAAAYDWLPSDGLAAGWLLLAVAGCWAARRLADRALAVVALAIAALGVVRVAASVPDLWVTAFGSLLGEPALAAGLPAPTEALPLLALPGALLLAGWRLLPDALARARRALAAAGLLCLVATLYITAKQVFAIETRADFVARGFAERTAITQLLFLAGWWLSSGRTRRLGERAELAGGIVTAIAAARLVWFDLLLHNPALAAQNVGAPPILNLIVPAYFLGAFWLWQARRRADGRAKMPWLLLFLAVLVVGALLMVRQMFHGPILTGVTLPRGEFYGYSLAGLLLAIALFVAGLRRSDEPLRVAGLAVLTATVLKVFLVDAAALEGLLRILSFLGLGIALIGVGKLYGAVLGRDRAAA